MFNSTTQTPQQYMSIIDTMRDRILAAMLGDGSLYWVTEPNELYGVRRFSFGVRSSTKAQKAAALHEAKKEWERTVKHGKHGGAKQKARRAS